MHRTGVLASRGKSALRWSIRTSASVLSHTVPLRVRKALVVWAGRRKLPGCLEFSMGMLRDMQRKDPDAFCRFLWTHHLAYAMSYEIPVRFGASNINPSRSLLFQDIVSRLESTGIDPRKDVASIFEIGCSSGYLLRHLETEVFPSAIVLRGLDIDRRAIQAGREHLRSLQSRVELFAADMAAAERLMGNQVYDLVLCCGVLMYVNQDTAQQVVETMLSHARRLVALICLAHPEGPHAGAGKSELRNSDGAFIHDVESMIRQANGKLLSSKWVGTSISGSSPSWLILVEPPSANRHATGETAA